MGKKQASEKKRMYINLTSNTERYRLKNVQIECHGVDDTAAE